MDATVFAGHLRAFNYPEHPHTRSYEDRKTYGLKTAFLSNSFAAYRRSTLSDNEWFLSGLILGEDTCMAAKMLMQGSKIAYEPDACVYHSHNYSIWEDFRRYFDTGVFHTSQSWLIESFGKAEGEGMRYIRSEIAYMNRGGNLHLLPEFFIRNLMKFSGYKAGSKFRLMPRALARSLSMHRGWWDRSQGPTG
jgi:rhamnosyltransferase